MGDGATVRMDQKRAVLKHPFPIIRASVSDMFGDVYAFVVEIRPRSYRAVWADRVGVDQCKRYLASGRKRDVRQDCDQIKALLRRPQEHGWMFRRITWMHIAKYCGFIAVQFDIGEERREFVLWRTYLRRMVGASRANQLMDDYLGGLDRPQKLTITGLPLEILNIVIVYVRWP
jgi:hypothetical protein